MTKECVIGELTVGGKNQLAVIAGPCVLEDSKTNDLIAQSVRDACAELNLSYIFKASFDKANRSSIHSARGPGLKAGLEELARLKSKFNITITTDIHQTDQVQSAAEVVDMLQIPAFLCRQTDLLLACASAGKPINVKKGQFLSPAEMKHVIDKLEEGGCDNILVTERGTFFGYHRLVNDFVGLGDLMELGRPVCFDATHSTQLPGGDTSSSGGRPDRADVLLRAAVAAGVDAVFIECHPDPAHSLSDASTAQPLNVMPALLQQANAIRNAVKK